mgnify:CR=1 FL=1
MKITMTTDRRLTIIPHERGLIVREETRRVRPGYSKESWDQDVILLTKEEILRLAEIVTSAPATPR